MELLGPKVIIFFQIVFIDIVMAADNAIIIGLIASSFPSKDRKRIILFGVFGAFLFRVIFAAITVQLLQYPILKIIGGVLLIWIVFKLFVDLRLFPTANEKEDGVIKSKKTPSFFSAIYAVIIADVTLSFDNVLGVAAAALRRVQRSSPVRRGFEWHVHERSDPILLPDQMLVSLTACRHLICLLLRS